MNIWNEYLNVAISVSKDIDSKEKLLAIKPIITKIEQYEKTFIKRINESKAARGEKTTQLRKNEKIEIASYDQDAIEITKEVCASLQQFDQVRDVIRILRSSLKSEIKNYKNLLKHYHSAELHIAEERIILYEQLLEAFDNFLPGKCS